jgi:ribosomal protein S25
MTFFKQVKRIERIDKLINSNATGTPSELAEKLGLSVSHMHQTMKILKEEMNAPIYYSKVERAYRYRKNVRFVCTFVEAEKHAELMAGRE